MPAKNTTRREPWNPLLKGYPFSEKVNAVSVGAETLFTRLVAQADDFGNYFGNPKQILAYLYGHRFASGQVTATDTGRWRAELVSNPSGPLAVIYEVNGSEYIHLINSRRRLRNDVAPDERFPREPANIQEQAISDHVTRTGRTRTVNGALDLDKTETRPRQDSDQEKLLGETDSPDLFEVFWQEFIAMNRKEAKTEARKAWTTTTVNGRPGKVNGHKPVDPSVIIQAAKHYREFNVVDGTEPKFIKHAATFLGPDRHWEDWDKPKPSSNGNGTNRALTRGAEEFADVFEES